MIKLVCKKMVLHHLKYHKLDLQLSDVSPKQGFFTL